MLQTSKGAVEVEDGDLLIVFQGHTVHLVKNHLLFPPFALSFLPQSPFLFACACQLLVPVAVGLTGLLCEQERPLRLNRSFSIDWQGCRLVMRLFSFTFALQFPLHRQLLDLISRLRHHLLDTQLELPRI